MKKQLAGLFALVVMASMGVWMISCGNSNSPSSPSGNASTATSTFTPTITYTPAAMRWYGNYIINLVTNGVSAPYAAAFIDVNSTAETTDNVVLTGSNISTPVTMVYQSTSTYSGLPYAEYYIGSTGWTYVAGQTYVMTVHSIAGGTAAATIVAPGGVTIAANGLSATWTNLGSYANSAQVLLGATTEYSATSGLTSSPYTIPGSAYPGPGTYTTTLQLENSVTVPGIYSGTLLCEESNSKSITVLAVTATSTSSATNTTTNTVTSTGTLTIVPTSTPTLTPTQTPSPTITNTATNTNSSTITLTPTNTATNTNTPTGPHWRFAGSESVIQTQSGQLAYSGGSLYVNFLNTTGDVSSSTYNGTSWTSPNSGSLSAFQFSSYTDNGNVYAFFGDSANSDFGTVMELSGGTWSNVGTQDFLAQAFYNAAMYVYDNGTTSTPYIAYGDANNGYKVTVMKFDGTNWVLVGNADFSAGQVTALNLTADSSGKLYVAYEDFGTSSKATVMTLNGTTWLPVGGSAGISPGTAQYVSLYVSGTTPYLAYQDCNAQPNGTSVLTYSGTAWSNVGSTQFSATQARYVSLYVTGTTPYVAFQDANAANSNATVMKYSAGAWSAVGGADFTPGSASYLSLIVNGSIPYLAFEDGNGPANTSSVMYYQ